ncbi:hypothetical protein [Bacillus sp. FJAT-49711]
MAKANDMYVIVDWHVHMPRRSKCRYL